MKVICWNVNGLRAVWKKGFLDFLEREMPDVLCVQETKMQSGQVTQELLNPLGYFSHWAFAERAGYSGVATFSQEKPRSVQIELGGGRHDSEGRLVLTEFDEFTLVNVYIPNGGMGDHRVEYKLNYYDEMLDMLERLRKEGRFLIICGDFNTAHTEMDLARPQDNVNVSGFLPVERAWMDRFIEAGYVDMFRHLHPDARDAYTWWSFRTAARKRNVGWRIDYFFVNKEFAHRVKRCEHLDDVEGSDHCPLMLEF